MQEGRWLISSAGAEPSLILAAKPLAAHPIATALGTSIGYFEVRVVGGASVGLASSSTLEYGARQHVGWAKVLEAASTVFDCCV